MKIEEIKQITENFFNLKLEERSRETKYVQARASYIYLLFKYSSEHLTYKKVGDSISRNHATVIYNRKEFPNIFNYDKLYAKTHLELEKLIKKGSENYTDKQFKKVFNNFKKEELIREIVSLKSINEKVLAKNQKRKASIKRLRTELSQSNKKINSLRQKLYRRESRIKQLKEKSYEEIF